MGYEGLGIREMRKGVGRYLPSKLQWKLLHLLRQKFLTRGQLNAKERPPWTNHLQANINPKHVLQVSKVGGFRDVILLGKGRYVREFRPIERFHVRRLQEKSLL